jgi:hypothetical protein
VLEKANSGTIVRLFKQSLSLLWPGIIQRENILLFLSDAAPYMIKAGKALKLLYSKMEHVKRILNLTLEHYLKLSFV